MPVRLTETFDGGTDGNTIVAGGNIDAVSGTPVYTNDAMHGGMAMAGGTTTSQAVRIDITPDPTTHSGSIYIKPTGIISSGTRVVQFATDLSVLLGALRFHSDGLIDITSGTTRIDSSNFSWTDSAWHRFDWQCDASGASIVVTGRLFSPANVEGSTPDDTISATMASGTLGRMFFGCLGGNAGTTIKADTIRLADGLEWIDPFVGITGTGAAALGALGSTAPGVRGVAGIATASPGALGATVAGQRSVGGTAAASLGAGFSTMSGVRAVAGSAVAVMNGPVGIGVGIGVQAVRGTISGVTR
jgi:hypothetical protein